MTAWDWNLVDFDDDRAKSVRGETGKSTGLMQFLA
jgi:hypothetical protein